MRRERIICDGCECEIDCSGEDAVTQISLLRPGTEHLAGDYCRMCIGNLVGAGLKIPHAIQQWVNRGDLPRRALDGNLRGPGGRPE